jgi:hypothetical protein
MCYQIFRNIVFGMCYKTSYLNEEVNCTELSSSVSVPYSNILGWGLDKRTKNLRNVRSDLSLFSDNLLKRFCDLDTMSVTYKVELKVNNQDVDVEVS